MQTIAHVQKALSEISSAIATLTGDSDDMYLLRQFEEQLVDIKRDLDDTCSDLLELEMEEYD